MLKKGSLFICLLLCFTFASAGESVRVNYVIDGDTITVIRNGREEKVRLIGIDAPESRENQRAKRDSKNKGADISTIIKQGKRSTAFVRSIVKKGDLVTLEYDVQAHDRYGRLLAYVYLSDNRFLNELIIKSGYAAVLTVQPNVKYQKRFIEAYQYAQKNNVGLWADK